MPTRIAFIGRSRSVCGTSAAEPRLHLHAGARCRTAATCAATTATRGRRSASRRRRCSGPARLQMRYGGVLGARARRAAAPSSGFWSMHEGVVDRDEDPPRQRAARQHQAADVEADDEADAEQRGREVDAEEADRALAEEARDGERLRREAQARERELEERAGRGGERERLQAAARVLRRPSAPPRSRRPRGTAASGRGSACGAAAPRTARRAGRRGPRSRAPTSNRSVAQWPMITSAGIVKIVPAAIEDAGRGAGRDDVVLEDARAAEQRAARPSRRPPPGSPSPP